MGKRRSKGEGTIYQNSKGLWVAQVTLPNGKRKVKYSKTQKVVKDWLLGQRKAVEEGNWVDNDRLNISSFLDRYMEDVAAHTLRPKTIESYDYLIRLHIKPEIGNLKLTALRPDHLQNLYSKKLNQGLSKRTVHYVHAVVHKALHQAMKWGLVSKNVADLADPPAVKRQTPKTLTLEQIKQLLAILKNDRLYPLYTLAVGCGLREGELLGLYWEDVDFFSGTLHIQRSVQQLKNKGLYITEPKSEKSKRTIAVPGFALDILWDYKEKYGKVSGLVFSTSNSTPFSPRNLIRHYKSALVKANLPDLPFHSLRHSFASIQLLAGTNPKIVQEALGHSQISLTLDTYSHVIPSLQKEAAEKMNELFRK
jgi:integrase